MAKKRKREKKTLSSSRAELGRKKAWMFRIISVVVIPLLLFGGLEAGLRIVGFGYPTKALIERDLDGKRMCFRNARFAWRFFPHQMARQFPVGLVFEKEKEPDTFRVFVLGASAARGDPEAMVNFGRMLQAMLNDLYPDIDFEVHNAAMVAINSHVVREIARDCAKYDPDLFIVYLGNNEVVGPYGPGTVFTHTPPVLPLIRANITAKATKVGQLFDTLIGAVTSSGQAPQWAGLTMFLDKQVRPDSRALERVYHNFEKNLQDICRIGHRSGAKVIVSNVGSNLRDCSPLASLHREDISNKALREWEAVYKQGVDLEDRGLYRQAIERYMAAAAIDDTFADLQFRLGRSHWESGDYEKARLHYQLAMQNDTLRFRADARINSIIRRTAADRTGEGIYFADSKAAFAAASPQQLPGSDLFFDHVHLKHKGNYILARTMIPFVQQMVPATAKPQGEVMDIRQLARRIAYTKYDEHQDLNFMYRTVLSRPPFTNQLYHNESMNKIRAELISLRKGLDVDECVSQYDEAIRENPDDWRLRIKQFELIAATKGMNDPEGMGIKMRQIAKLHPNGEASRLLGNMLILQGRLKEAEDVLNRSLFINPDSGKTHVSLARIDIHHGERTRAIRHLRQAIMLEPTGSIEQYTMLAEQYDHAGKTEKAIQMLQQALRLFPANLTAAVHLDLARLLYKQDERLKASQHIEAALQLRPDYAESDEFMYLYRIIKGR